MWIGLKWLRTGSSDGVLWWCYSLTHSMEQSPSWEANRFSAGQKIPRLLWKPEVHYRIHKCSPPVPFLRQLDPVHDSTSHFLKIHLIIILPSIPGSSKWPLSLRFPHQNPVYTSLWWFLWIKYPTTAEKLVTGYLTVYLYDEESVTLLNTWS